MKKDECYCLINPKTGKIVGADPNAYLDAYSHSEEGERKIYFKTKGSYLMKFLKGLNKFLVWGRDL